MTRPDRHRFLHFNPAMTIPSVILLAAAPAAPADATSTPAAEGLAVPATGEALDRCRELPSQPPDIEAPDSWTTLGGRPTQSAVAGR